MRSASVLVLLLGAFLAAAAATPLSHADRALVTGAQKELATFAGLSLKTLAGLEEVERRTPRDPEVTALLIAGYRRRDDWSSLVAVGLRKPAAQRSPDDLRNLALWLIADARPGEAVELLAPVVRKGQADVRLEVLLGTAFFQLGDDGQAVPYLEKAALDPRDPASIDAVTQRALIELRRRELAAAERRLRAVVAASPEADGAANALGRVLVAQGRREEGARWLARAEEIRTRKAEERRRQLTLSALSMQLSDEVVAKRYDAAERTAARMLALSDPALKARLLRYLAEVRTAAGRTAEAQRALAEAAAVERGLAR